MKIKIRFLCDFLHKKRIFCVIEEKTDGIVSKLL